MSQQNLLSSMIPSSLPPLPIVYEQYQHEEYTDKSIRESLASEKNLRLPVEILDGWPGMEPCAFYEAIICKKLLPNAVKCPDPTRLPLIISDDVKLPDIIRRGYGIQQPREFFNRVWYKTLPAFSIGDISEDHCGRRLRPTDSFSSTCDPYRQRLNPNVEDLIRGIPGACVYDMKGVFCE